jgi:hypothetical protein
MVAHQIHLIVEYSLNPLFKGITNNHKFKMLRFDARWLQIYTVPADFQFKNYLKYQTTNSD